MKCIMLSDRAKDVPHGIASGDLGINILASEIRSTAAALRKVLVTGAGSPGVDGPPALLNNSSSDSCSLRWRGVS